MKCLNCFYALGQALFFLETQLVAAEPPQRPISGAETVLAIYNKGFGRMSAPHDIHLIRAIWNDGYTVWSADRIRGGPPYYFGWIDPKRLHSLLFTLERDGLFAEKGLARNNFGPDSDITTILIRFGKKQIEMSSWHELAESEGRVVANASGLVGLDGRQLFRALKVERSEYMLFRFVWSEIRAAQATCSLGLKSRRGRVDLAERNHLLASCSAKLAAEVTE